MTLIRPATSDDAAAIAAIYAYYVVETAISFEVDPPDAAEMRKRMERSGGLYPWLVAERDSAVAGYAYAYPYHERAAYRWVAGAGIYVAREQHRRGIGRKLHEALLDALEEQGFVAAIGAITLPNKASVGLHEALDFEHVGTQKRIGFKLGEWRDVGLWQLDLAPRKAEPAEPKPARSQARSS